MNGKMILRCSKQRSDSFNRPKLKNKSSRRAESRFGEDLWEVKLRILKVTVVLCVEGCGEHGWYVDTTPN